MIGLKSNSATTDFRLSLTGINPITLCRVAWLLSTQSAQFAHQNGIKSPLGVVLHVLQAHCMLEQPVHAHATARNKEVPISVLLLVSIKSCLLLHAMLYVSQSH